MREYKEEKNSYKNNRLRNGNYSGSESEGIVNFHTSDQQKEKSKLVNVMNKKKDKKETETKF